MAEIATMEVRARLSAETASFTKGMQQASQAVDSFVKQSNALRGAMVGIGIASAAGIAGIVAFGTKSFMAAARVDELDIAMNAVGKSTGLGYEAIRTATVAIKDSGIEMEIAQKAALKFAQNNIELTRASELARVAQDLAVISGMNSTDTFNMLTHAVITGRSEVLKSVGIQKSAGAMYEEFARSIGKSASALTAQEKQTAVLNGALAEGAKVAGTYEAAMTSPGKVLRSFARVQNEIQVGIGGVLLKGLGPLIFSAYNLVKAFAKAVEGSATLKAIFKAVEIVITKLTQPFVNMIDKITDFVKNIDKASAKTEAFTGIFDTAQINVRKLAGSIEFALPFIAAFAAAFATFAGASIFRMVPILGTLLGALAGPIGIIVVVMATLYATSSQVREAMNSLFASLKPVGEALIGVGKAFIAVGSTAVSILSFAIKGLATTIQAVSGFLERNRVVLIVLKSAVGGLVAAFVIYKTVMMAQIAISKIMAVLTAIQVGLTNSVAIATAKQTVATATLGVAQAQAVVAAALLNVELAAQAVAAGGGAAAEVALTTATVALATAEAGATAATGALATATTGLAAAESAAIAPIFLVVAGLAAAVIAFVYAWKESETFREVMTDVFNFVAKIVGEVLGFIFGLFGNLLLAFGNLIDIHNTFGKTVADVFQFVYKTMVDSIIFILGSFKRFLDGFVNLFETHQTFKDIVVAVFNVIMRIIAMAVTAVIVTFATLIKGIATLVHYFTVVRDFIGDVWIRITKAISEAGSIIGDIVHRIARVIGEAFLDRVRDDIAGFIRNLANAMSKIPLIGGAAASALNLLASHIDTAQQQIEKIEPPKFDTTDLIKNGEKSIDLLTRLSTFAITGAKSWGNYTSGTAGALSTVANTMLKFSQVVVDFTAKDLGGNVLEGLIKGAKAVSPVLEKTIKLLKDVKDVKVGEFLVKNTSEAAVTAGNFMLGLAASIKSFTSTDFVGKVGTAFGDLMEKLKTGLGFGDILGDLKKTFSAAGGGDSGVPTDDTLTDGVKRIDAIREAMQAGIDAIRGVLDDLRQAAKDFADSLKETIVNFAGLKGVELPDGFIPKAKSLIANMELRLNKSQQFAGQIAQLQSMNLDVDALKAIIEEGPLKGAQLAASILGGGQEAVDEVSRLQRGIQFAGASIGAIGSDIAYSQKIATAQATLDSFQNDAMSKRTSGSNVFIEQGAFQIVVDTRGAANADEATGLVTKKIEETFAILAKQLASK